jgi:hypothetical protein
MKNSFSAQLATMKSKSYLDGLDMGKQIERMAMMIAVNEVFGLAGERLKRLEPVLDEIYKEMKADEPELFVEHLLRRVRQIKGITVDTGEHEDHEKGGK